MRSLAGAVRGAAAMALAGALVLASGPAGAQGRDPGQGGVTPPSTVPPLAVPAGPLVGQAAPGGVAAMQAIAVVDFRLIQEQSLAGQSLKKAVETQREQVQRSLISQEERLRSMEQDLARQRQTLAPEAFEDRRRAFEQQVAETRRATQAHMLRLDTAFNDALTSLNQSIMRLVAEVAQERSAVVVLPRNVILYQASPAMDITDTVLQRLNRTMPDLAVNLPK